MIQIVSDVVCPWCYIGKRRLEKALALLGRQDLPIQWRPFELNPHGPPEGYPRAEYRARKFGSAAYARELEDRVAFAAAEEGLRFQFDRIGRVPNTFDAHRLIWLAGRESTQDAMVESLFRAYFIEGQDIGSPVVLEDIGCASGIDSTAFRSGAGASEVRAEAESARLKGVEGVPTFFVDGKPVMSGAHKPELLASILGPVLGSGQCSLENGSCG
jgi:predicted DsbA family dithiol-disulfide isomerase